MSRLTFPLGAAGFSAGGALDLADAALPLAFSAGLALDFSRGADGAAGSGLESRSEEDTFELQLRQYLLCRLLLVKKKHVDRIEWPCRAAREAYLTAVLSYVS